MTNVQIADVFDEIADLLEFQGANPFRVRAYRNAARVIRDLPEPVAAMLDDADRQLTDLEGIGKDLAGKIAALVHTGQLPQLKELQQQVPHSVLALMRIPGLGPKRAAILHKQLGVSSLVELKAACEAGRVRQLKGFGARTEQAILQGIHLAASAEQRLYWADADQIASSLRQHFVLCPCIRQWELAGSYRRGKETVGDLDILVVSEDPSQVMDWFARFPDAAEVIGRGGTKMSIRSATGFQVDLRVVPAESFGAALQYFTGSKEHNVVLRGLARQKGLKINEYGVYRVQEGNEHHVAGASEEEVYAALDLPVFPPELREARQEFEWAEEGELPSLVELADIRGDLHMHTDETDGRASLEEMVDAARQRGLKYIAITDHSQRVSMARGLDSKRLLQQWSAIDRMNRKIQGDFIILRGIECDILERGGLDLPDDILAQADWVNASVHYGQRQSRQQITERILEAVENPYVSAVAHPTGRLIGRREPYDVDLDAVLRAAREHNTVMELNANPMRLDLNDVFCAAAKKHGVLVAISTDAHSPEGLDDLRYGVMQARRGGLTKKDVANTRTWPQLRVCVGTRRTARA